MKKRALSLVMAAAVAGTMLTGCGSTEGEKTADKKDSITVLVELSLIHIQMCIRDRSRIAQENVEEPAPEEGQDTASAEEQTSWEG